MPFTLRWTIAADSSYRQLQSAAEKASATSTAKGRTKSSKQEGLFKQIQKTLRLLQSDPRHNSLHCHEYSGLTNPYDQGDKVWEAYAQNNTPAAYRIFWCYGKDHGEITILAITAHP